MPDSIQLYPPESGPLRAGTSTDSGIAVPITGDDRVDALIEHDDGHPVYRWNDDQPLGTPLARPLTYSFMAAKPAYGGTDSGTDRGFQPFSEVQKAAARAIFRRLESETGLRFQEVADSATSYGVVRLGNNQQEASAGYAYRPDTQSAGLAGDVWLSTTSSGALTDLSPGSFSLATMIHEIGHAIGLKHPGNYNAGESASAEPGNYLGSDEENTLYTIMSYNDAPNGLQRDWFGIYDLLALQALYGAGGGNAGDTVHRVTDANRAWMSTIYDSGGTDTLDASATTTFNFVVLRPGAFSSLGGADDNLSIDLSTVIERYVGGSGSDRVLLYGGAHTIDGGAGIDKVIYPDSAAGYSRSYAGGVLTVRGARGADTLTNVERLSFTDADYAFDAAAQTTAKILGAVFGRAAVGNPTYAGIGLSMLDAGWGYAELMQMALGARFGARVSNETLVQTLYANVAGQAAGAGEVAYFSSMVSSGQFTQATLAVMAAETAFNAANVNLVGIAASGLAFVPGA